MFEKELVKNYMTKNPITIQENENFTRAYTLLDPDKFRHLPVINNKKEIVGIISDRDIRNVSAAADILSDSASDSLSKLMIKDIMSREIEIINSDENLQTAAAFMIENRINALPVVENNQFVGIITSTDLMQFILDN